MVDMVHQSIPNLLFLINSNTIIAHWVIKDSKSFLLVVISMSMSFSLHLKPNLLAKSQIQIIDPTLAIRYILFFSQKKKDIWDIIIRRA